MKNIAMTTIFVMVISLFLIADSQAAWVKVSDTNDIDALMDAWFGETSWDFYVGRGTCASGIIATTPAGSVQMLEMHANPILPRASWVQETYTCGITQNVTVSNLFIDGGYWDQNFLNIGETVIIGSVTYDIWQATLQSGEYAVKGVGGYSFSSTFNLVPLKEGTGGESVPEPASVLMYGLAGLGVAVRRFRK